VEALVTYSDVGVGIGVGIGIDPELTSIPNSVGYL
jgi:hypothetical protein